MSFGGASAGVYINHANEMRKAGAASDREYFDLREECEERISRYRKIILKLRAGRSLSEGDEDFLKEEEVVDE